MAVQKVGKMRRYAPLRDAVSACVGKTKWGDELMAQRAVSRIRQENPDEMDSTVRPYVCRATGKTHWHIGHGQ